MLRASCLLVLLVVFQPRADFRTGVKVVRVDAEVSEAGRLIDGRGGAPVTTLRTRRS